MFCNLHIGTDLKAPKNHFRCFSHHSPRLYHHVFNLVCRSVHTVRHRFEFFFANRLFVYHSRLDL